MTEYRHFIGNNEWLEDEHLKCWEIVCTYLTKHDPRMDMYNKLIECMKRHSDEVNQELMKQREIERDCLHRAAKKIGELVKERDAAKEEIQHLAKLLPDDYALCDMEARGVIPPAPELPRPVLMAEGSDRSIPYES